MPDGEGCSKPGRQQPPDRDLECRRYAAKSGANAVAPGSYRPAADRAGTVVDDGDVAGRAAPVQIEFIDCCIACRNSRSTPVPVS